MPEVWTKAQYLAKMSKTTENTKLLDAVNNITQSTERILNNPLIQKMGETFISKFGGKTDFKSIKNQAPATPNTPQVPNPQPQILPTMNKHEEATILIEKLQNVCKNFIALGSGTMTIDELNKYIEENKESVIKTMEALL